jgi:hypothetical protein
MAGQRQYRAHGEVFHEPCAQRADMNKSDTVALAKRYFLSLDGSDLPNLIRRIQKAQGNPSCFATGKQACPDLACPWHVQCQHEGGAQFDAVGESTGNDHE